MSFKQISLKNLVSQKNHNLFLPHIQRPFVWGEDQIIRLMDSLMRNYPIQTLLLWKTKERIKARRFMSDIESEPDLSDYYDDRASESGVEKTLVLDGQQRLQALFSVFDGSIYGKELYINLLGGIEELEEGLFHEFKLSSKELKLPFFKIKRLTVDNRNADEIADAINDELDELLKDEDNARERQRQVRKNISQLISLIREDKHFWYDELDGISNNYSYDTVLNIFIRVNSGGTKLDAADLMFAAMKEAWEDVELHIEGIVDMLNNSGRLNFDKTFVLKCLMSVIDKGAVLLPKMFLGEDGDNNLKAIKNEWIKVSGAFEQLRDFIQNDLVLYSDKVIRSYNAFAPILEYLYLHPGPDARNKSLLKSYYYKAQIFNWYSSRTDQLLNVMHNILRNNPGNEFPLSAISKYYIDLKKLTAIGKDHLNDTRLRYIILNLVYVETQGRSPFNVAYKLNEPHIDHIYPKSKMKYLSTNEVNHIGNYRFVGASENIRKSAELPDSYFSRLREVSAADVKKHLLVDMYAEDPNKMTLSSYIDFRNKRIDEIFNICSMVINK